jgi:hypothetical protein
VEWKCFWGVTLTQRTGETKCGKKKDGKRSNENYNCRQLHSKRRERKM